MSRWIGFLLPLLSFLSPFIARAEIDPASVVIVANSSDPKSVDLAKYYAEKREVPAENIIALPMPAAETLSGMDFVEKIWDPLTETLIEEGWISGSVRNGRDDYTRQNVMVFGHKIGAMVVCKGVPLRVNHEKLFYSEADAKRLPKPFQTTRSSVDSELALLAAGPYRLAGPMRNPVYNEEDPSSFALEKVVRVSRLDGPSYAAAQRMIDSAIQAEKEGLKGRAYVDIGGPHKNGDKWLGEVAELLGGTDYDLDVDRGRPIMKASARFDAPALYFGWYTRSVAGVWKDLDVAVPPGAIAFHIHSFSATTVRKRNVGWSGPLIDRGVAATVGNVFEPYLEGTHNPVLFLDSLLKGKSLAEAAVRSNRFFSWQTVLFGDPLYRPFALPLEEQLKDIDPMNSFDQYVITREMNRLIREEGEEAAADYGKRKFMQCPGFALALKTATLLRTNGRSVEALDLLSPFRYSVNAAPDEIAVVVGIAEEFNYLGDTATALRLLEAMTNAPGAPLDLQLSVLQKAAEVAKDAGEYVKAEQFRQIYEQRKPPPPEPKKKS
ncbi:TIGR03790 family protein [Puniceicoccus vermicola]|uniref:TIGR03790 family protein n=1 Tax=Puniceicoccus vermicola TaxID=388746 RepID=A0A7X1AWN7_9BACT|nr:TIGR03790 family protein [Puniceicoccus vermicola]MBC2600433.1 TIGR03790 family protein [Puniceicoccus vermicola]